MRLCVCLYVSGTEACPTGRSTLVILRCHLTDATESTTTTTTTTTTGPEAGSSDAAGSNSGAGVKVSLSSRCATGTCDGCNFVLMMRSSAGCHVCTQRDFHTYKTLCIDGHRQIITDMITYVSISMSVCLSLSVRSLGVSLVLLLDKKRFLN